MARILMTGGTGLLGSKFVAEYAQHHDLHLIVRVLPKALLRSVTYHVIDLASQWGGAALPAKVDAVMHLAQAREMRGFPESAPTLMSVNTASTLHLLDYARRAGARCFVLTSSGGLYQQQSFPLRESNPIGICEGPLAFYFQTKRSAEELAASYRDMMNIIVFRPFFIYGPDQWPSMLVSRLISSVRQHLPVTLKGEGGAVLNPVYVADAARALGYAIELDESELINLAGPEATSIREMALEIGVQLGVEPLFERQDGVPESYLADISRLVALIGRPVVNFARGLELMLSAGKPG